MKTRKVTRLALAMLMTALLSVLAAAPAFAAVNPGNVTAGAVSLDKYVVCEPDANIPAGTFTFAITVPDSDIAATSTELPVYKGITANGYPKIGTDNTVSVAANATATNANAKVALGDDSTTRKAAKVSFTIDFGSDTSAVSFPKPGVYRYYVTEQTPSSPFSIYSGPSKASIEGTSMTAESAITTVDIYIANGASGLVYQGFAAYNGKVETAPKANETAANSKASGATKDGKHVNLTMTESLAVEKVVAGNQGDKDDEFTFEVALTNLGSGTVIKVDSTNNTATNITPAPTDGNITTTGGTATITATVKDGQKLALSGIPETAQYTAKEQGVTGTTARTHNKGYIVTGEVQTAKVVAGNNSVTITNTREGAIPTGVMTAMIPGLILVALAVLALMRRRAGSTK